MQGSEDYKNVKVSKRRCKKHYREQKRPAQVNGHEYPIFVPRVPGCEKSGCERADDVPDAND